MISDITNRRTLSSFDTINDLRPIPGADAIEVGSVRGWDVVVRKGEFRNGDEVLFVEPDAAVPVDVPPFRFLKERGTKDIDGRDYHVLKTVRLRGQYSQGLAIRLSDAPYVGDVKPEDLDEVLGIHLYEKPVPLGARGNIKGAWPWSWLPKTDSERVQNLPGNFLANEQVDELLWYATEKIDGMSVTYVLEGDELRVASRNWELKTDNPNIVQLRVAEGWLVEFMRDHCLTAVQGEIFGEGIQSNRLKVKGQHLRLFDGWQKSSTGKVSNRIAVLSSMAMSATLPDLLVPFHVREHELVLPVSREVALEQVTGLRSLINPDVQAEGLVWHKISSGRTFKAINPEYLVKHGL